MVSPFVAPYGERCTTCHSGPNPSSGYIFKMPRLELDYPVAAPFNTTISVTVRVVHPGNYDLRAPRATVTVSGPGGLMPDEPATKPLVEVGSSGGSASSRWNLLTGGSNGTLFISARLNFTAHFRHIGTHQNDESPYVLMRSGQVSVRPVVIFATSGEVILRTDGTDQTTGFQLITYSEAHNVSLTTSSNLKGTIELAPAFIRSLASGQQQFISINLEDISGEVNNGRIDIAWENATGTRDASFVTVRFLGPQSSPPAAGNSPLRLMGRITGLLSLGLLISSLALGIVKWGGKRRVRVHCAISWFIVGLSVYHGVMLVLGPYSRQIWGDFVLLGYVSAAVMGVSGVNGLAQSWMSRVAGYTAWQWTHRITIILAVVLVLIHGIYLGTDFAFLRNLFQGGPP